MKQYKYCLCQYNDEPDSLYIAELYVPKAYRHQGHGNKALDEAIHVAKSRGIKCLKLSVDRYSWKYKWYVRRGFKVFLKRPLKMWMEIELNKNTMKGGEQ